MRLQFPAHTLYSRLTEALIRACSRYLQRAHLRYLFTAMGRIAKSAGQVTPEHIACAEGVLQRLGCTGKAREHAIAWFREGRDNDADFHRLAMRCNRHPDTGLNRLVLESLVNVAEVRRTPAVHRTLHLLTSLLGLDATRVQGELRAISSEKNALAEARHVLGIDEDATADTLRGAYRQLASRYHPDKLPPGATEQERAHAVSRSIEIRGAYDLLRQATVRQSGQ